MATLKQVVRYGLLNFPCIFPEPVYVMEHLFCVIGNGYEWNRKGELESVFEERDYNSGQMNYSDVDEAETYAQTMKDQYYLNDLYNGIMLRTNATRIRRKFIEDNMDMILSAPLTSHYFEEYHRGGSYVISNISENHARGLDFPDNINKEWGEELYKFLDHWLVSLNKAYGVSVKDHNDISFWPKNAQDGYNAILAARERLYPLIHDGMTYAEHVKECNELSERLISEVINDKH